MTTAVRAPSRARQNELQDHFRRGLRVFESGDFDGATRIWQTVWDEWPAHPEVGAYLVKAHLYQGIQLFTDGSYADAMDRCERVLAIDPQNEKAARYLANIREEQLGLQGVRSRAR